MENNENNIEKLRDIMCTISDNDYYKLHMSDLVSGRTESSEEFQNRNTLTIEKLQKVIDKPIFTFMRKMNNVIEHENIHLKHCVKDMYRYERSIVLLCKEHHFHISFTEKESDLLPEFHKMLDEREQEKIENKKSRKHWMDKTWTYFCNMRKGKDIVTH